MRRHIWTVENTIAHYSHSGFTESNSAAGEIHRNIFFLLPRKKSAAETNY